MAETSEETSRSVGRAQKGKSAYDRLKSGRRYAEQIKDLAYLHRGVLTGLDCPTISSASITPNRLAILDDDKCLLASENKLYFVKWEPQGDVEDVKAGTQGLGISTILPFSSLQVRKALPHSQPQHRVETQSIARPWLSRSQSAVFATIDGSGSILVHKLEDENSFFGDSELWRQGGDGLPSQDNVSSSPRKKRLKASGSSVEFTSQRLAQPKSCESAWAGLSFQPEDASTIASTHFFGKELRVHDANQGDLVSSFGLMLNPTQITFASLAQSSQPVIAVTEYNQLSIWDHRLKGNRACVNRSSPSRSACLYAVAASNDSVICAGSDRIVYVYDSRNWKIRNRWKCPLKYDCVSLHVSPTNPSVCYAGGLDNEIMCGEFSGAQLSRAGFSAGDAQQSSVSQSILQQNHRLGMRGDSSWTGLAVSSTSSVSTQCDDMVVGACESGSLYVVNRAQFMLPTLNDGDHHKAES